MGEVAVRPRAPVGYVGAGTIEMLYDSATRGFYFLEMNTRLQVEHPVTELVTGVDLVRWQLAVAQGEKLPLAQADIPRRGAAIECRVYAEDPVKFLPSPGTITSLRVPAGPGIRDDSGVVAGSVISVHYDPMISKLCAWADTRAAAIDRMRRAVGEYHVGGIRTNLAFHRQVMRHPRFIAGEYDTGFIERHKAELAPPPADAETPTLAAIAAAAQAARQGGAPDEGGPIHRRGVARPRVEHAGFVDRGSAAGAGAHLGAGAPRSVSSLVADGVRDALHRMGVDLSRHSHRGAELATALAGGHPFRHRGRRPVRRAARAWGPGARPARLVGRPSWWAVSCWAAATARSAGPSSGSPRVRPR